MKINIWAEKHNKYDIYSNFVAFYQLVDKWIDKYPHISFERKNFLPSSERENINKYALEDRKFIHNGHNSFFHFIVENENTKKYFLISYWDCLQNSYHEFQNYDFENLIEIFSSQGGHKCGLSFEETDVNYTPLNKVMWLASSDIEIQKLINLKEKNHIIRSIPNKLQFRVGDPYGFRTYLMDDSRFDIKIGNRIPESDHAQELNKNWINMDVYSVSGVSTRLIEGMGLGTAVLSPNFPQKHHSPIIPDYHYVKVEFDGLNLDYTNYKKLADSYIETFENLKKDPDRIYYISENAQKYYLENCTVDKHTDNLYNLLDLNKLS